MPCLLLFALLSETGFSNLAFGSVVIYLILRVNSASWDIFQIFCRLLIFSKSTVTKNSFRNTNSVSNSLDPDQARRSVGPDLGADCLKKVFSRRHSVGNEFIYSLVRSTWHGKFNSILYETDAITAFIASLNETKLQKFRSSHRMQATKQEQTFISLRKLDTLKTKLANQSVADKLRSSHTWEQSNRRTVAPESRQVK